MLNSLREELINLYEVHTLKKKKKNSTDPTNDSRKTKKS